MIRKYTIVIAMMIGFGPICSIPAFAWEAGGDPCQNTEQNCLAGQ